MAMTRSAARKVPELVLPALCVLGLECFERETIVFAHFVYTHSSVSG